MRANVSSNVRRILANPKDREELLGALFRSDRNGQEFMIHTSDGRKARIRVVGVKDVPTEKPR